MGSPTGSASFTHDGESYTLIFDMKAIAFFEQVSGISILAALQRLEEARLGGAMPMLSHLAYLMQAGLHTHHPDVTADEAMMMAVDAQVQKALGVGLQSAMPDAEGGEPGNAPAPTAETSTGTRPSKVRSKRGSR